MDIMYVHLVSHVVRYVFSFRLHAIVDIWVAFLVSQINTVPSLPWSSISMVLLHLADTLPTDKLISTACNVVGSLID